jgi:hypothetical protein
MDKHTITLHGRRMAGLIIRRFMGSDGAIPRSHVETMLYRMHVMPKPPQPSREYSEEEENLLALLADQARRPTKGLMPLGNLGRHNGGSPPSCL